MSNDSTVFRHSPFVLFSLLLLWMFGGVLATSSLLAYRDASHFFAHLFQLINTEWSAGRIPLWNPYNNCGTPLLANATSSVFYPGKLIFLLPVPYAWCYNLYVILHVVLAGWFAYKLSRNWATSQSGAAICAISYAFSGTVLYQYGNVIFLIGAAWLPAAIWVTDRMLRERSIRWSCGLGVILALVVLGGDPQMAYHIGLLALLYGVIIWRKGDHRQARATFWQRSLILLSIAAVCGIGLGAIQVLPTLEWSRECVRGRSVLPRNIYQIPGYLAGDARYDKYSRVNWYDELVGKASNPSPSEPIYEYSLPPWRLAEFVWPWFSGSSLSQYRRWIYAIAQERDWVPSLYFGVLPFVLAISGWKIRNTDPRTAWMSLGLALSLIASLGKYGLGFGIHCVARLGDNSAVGDAFGGLYWCMTVLLPGYAQFRWPSKILVITAICASVLAGMAWDRMVSGDRQANDRRLRVQRILLVLCMASVVGAVVITLLQNWEVVSLPESSYLGPFDTAGAFRDVLTSFILTATVCMVVLLLLRWDERQPASKWQLCLLAVVVIDVGIANRWMISATPANLLTNESVFHTILAESESKYGVDQPFRVFRESFLPGKWRQISSADRFAEFHEWASQTLYPMYHYNADVQLVSVRSETLRNFDHMHFLSPAQWPTADGQLMNAQPLNAIDAMNAKYLIVPTAMRDDLSNQLGADSTALQTIARSTIPDLGEFQCLYNRNHLPRSWIVHDVEVIPRIDRRDYGRIVETRMKIAFPGEIDLRQTAVVESDDLDGFSHSDLNGEEPCQVVQYTPQRVEIDVTMVEHGMVVLSDLYESNWRAFDQRPDGSVEPLKIYRTNRMMRGVILEPGQHRIVFEYSPTSFYVGAWISVLAWALVLIVVFRTKSKSTTA